MRIFGLTGGIGAGKSEAAQRFRERGIPVIDADRIGHEVLEPGGAAEKAVTDAFGPAILSEGRIDRQKLGEVVFNDAEARQRLNAIVHPAILQEVRSRIAELGQAGHDLVIVEAALLAEDGHIQDWMSGLILVTCPEDIRVQRLTENRSMASADARARIRAQTDPARKADLARWVVSNDGDLQKLYRQVDNIADEIRA